MVIKRPLMAINEWSIAIHRNLIAILWPLIATIYSHSLHFHCNVMATNSYQWLSEGLRPLPPAPLILLSDRKQVRNKSHEEFKLQSLRCCFDISLLFVVCHFGRRYAYFSSFLVLFIYWFRLPNLEVWIANLIFSMGSITKILRTRWDVLKTVLEMKRFL